MLFIGIILVGYLAFFSIGVVYFINTTNKANTIIQLTNNLDIKNENLESGFMIFEGISKNTIKSIFTKRKMLLEQMKKCVNNNDNRAKVKVYFNNLRRKIKVRIIIK